MPAAQKKKAASDRYAIELVDNKEKLKELQTYLESEGERFDKEKRKLAEGEKGPVFSHLLRIKPERYSMYLDIAKGKIPEKLKKKKRLPLPRYFALVLRDKETGKISGYTSHYSKGYSVSQSMVYVPPELRREGLGKILIRAREDAARDLDYPALEIKAENPRLRKHLMKSGYRKSPGGRYRMVKDLRPPKPPKKKGKKSEA